MTMENEELDYSDEEANGEAPNTDEENELIGMNEESGNRNEGGDDPYLELDCPDDYDQEDDDMSLNTTKTDRNDTRSEIKKDNQNRQTQMNRGRQVTLQGNQQMENQNNNGRPSRERKKNKGKGRPFRSRSKSLHRGQNNHPPRFPIRQHSPIGAGKAFTQNPWMSKAETKFMQAATDQPNATIFPTQNLQPFQVVQRVNQPPGLINDFSQRSQEPIQSISRNQIPLNQYAKNLRPLMGEQVLLSSQEFTNTGRTSMTMTSNNDFSITRTISGSGNNRQLGPCPPLVEGGLFNVNQKINNLNTFQNNQIENRNFVLNSQFNQIKENSSLGGFPRGNVSQTAEFYTGNPTYRSSFAGPLDIKNENVNRTSFKSNSFHQNMPKIQVTRPAFNTSNLNSNKNATQREINYPTRFKFNSNANKNKQNNPNNNNNTNQTNNKFNYRAQQNQNNSYRNSSFSDSTNFVSTNKNPSPKANNQRMNENLSQNQDCEDNNSSMERARPERPKTPRGRARSQDGRKTPIIIPETTPLDKELINQKKAERLQRFSASNVPLGAGSETGSNAGSLDWTLDQGNLNTSLEIDENYLRGIEEQKRKREEFFKQKLMKRKIDSSSSANAGPATAKKPNVSQRESIFNKKNPFDTDSEFLMDVDIKKEEDENVQEARNFANKSTPNASFSRDNVTFIRTISKSLEELGVKSRPSTPARSTTFTPISAPPRNPVNRPKSPHPKKCSTPKPKPMEMQPVVVEKTIVNEYATAAQPECSGSSTNQVPDHQNVIFANSQAPESVLNGCIVKIMNIPKTVTVEDVLKLCAPFGKVLEIKLNFPKENSAAVRFSNPSSAESFFNRYQGEKFGDLFLYLVVI